MNKANLKTKKQISIAEIILRFFLGFLIPYLLINGLIFFFFVQSPTINVITQDSKDFEEDKIKFSVDCLIPLSDVKVYFQDSEISYSKLGDTYVVDVNDNGTYKINVIAMNKSQANYTTEVETKDNVAPSIDVDNAVITGNTLIVSVSDDQSGINYDNVYAKLDDGTEIKPTYIDKSSGTIQFQIESGSKVTIHVEDDLGNHSETLFTIS